MKTALVILAAGKGTRMKSDLPKVLHPIAGAPMLVHAMESAAPLEAVQTVIVAGHGAEAVEAVARDHSEAVSVVLQEEQNGTAHAVNQARAALADHDGDVAVLYGDTPFVRAETLARMQDARKRFDIVVLGFNAADPGRYGRLVTEGEALLRIVEFADANAAEKDITLCNSGILMADRAILFDLIAGVGNHNQQGEYYLTDVPGIARERGLTAGVVICDEAETLGINSRADLAQAEAVFQANARAQALADGVTMTAPGTVYLSHDTVIGRDTTIEPNVVFGPGVTVESGATIRAFSHLEGCHVSRGAIVGPYARLRPGAELAEDVRIGNFVEVKNAIVDPGAKVNHLSYVGDAHVGAGANLGAGTITCNYDGVMKHHTEIGAQAFIGSNTMLVAPVSVGDGAMTATGSVITSDVPADAMAVARARQENKPGLAKKLFAMLRKKKQKRDAEAG